MVLFVLGKPPEVQKPGGGKEMQMKILLKKENLHIYCIFLNVRYQVFFAFVGKNGINFKFYVNCYYTAL